MKKNKSKTRRVLRSRVSFPCPGSPACDVADIDMADVEEELAEEGLTLADVDPILGKKLKSGLVLVPVSSIINDPAWIEASPGCWVMKEKSAVDEVKHER